MKRLSFESKAHEKWVTSAGIVGILIFASALIISSGSWVTFFITLAVIVCYLLFGHLRWGFTPYPNVIATERL